MLKASTTAMHLTSLSYFMAYDSPMNDNAHNPMLKEEQVAEMIDRLAPQNAVFAGKQFFHKLLKEKGVDGFNAFLEKATTALDSAKTLDLNLDFDDSELRLFHHCRPNIMTRRHFLYTVGLRTSGEVFFWQGVVDMLEKSWLAKEAQGHTAHAPQTEPEQTTPLSGPRDVLHETLGPPAEALIGAALVQEAKDKWVEMKLSQITKSVELLDLAIIKSMKAHDMLSQIERPGGQGSGGVGM